MSRKRPYCLTIAGFDPSGGAGLLADCKTFEQLHVQGLSVITSNTIQTEDQYFSTDWVHVSNITEQLIALLQRYPVRFIKIGLIENGAVLLEVLRTIHAHTSNPFILWDPILKPTMGGDMSNHRFSEQLDLILAHLNCITPNLPEFGQLFGSMSEKEVLASIPMIYLKGGHSEQIGKDHLFTQKATYPFNPKRLSGGSKHGTGCVLSAAFLAHLALDYPLVKAGLKSKRYLEYMLHSNESLLGYHSR